MKKLLLILAILKLTHAQAQFYAGSQGFTVKGGRQVSFENLSLQPSYDVTLINNMLQKSKTALPGNLNGYAQVGIGTTEPKAYLHVADGKDVLFGEDFSGYGNKFIWYGSKGAFRAGGISSGSPYPVSWDNTSVGEYSFAIGVNTMAGGRTSTAMGYQTTASARYSTAMGLNVSTNDKTGSFIIGDDNASTYNNLTDNQMMMRFGGGYVFYTGAGEYDPGTPGAEFKPNQTSWSVVSDSTRKENFRYTDGAIFLKKISSMRLGSWNYMGQDVKQYRHYGPMAQDLFAAFGHDELGVIGDDKSINQADFDGVNLIAIQALIRKVEAMEAENKLLKNSEAVMRDKLTSLEMETVSLKARMQQFEKQLSALMNAEAVSVLPT